VSDEYFASKPTQDFLGDVGEKIDQFQRYTERHGLKDKWAKLYNFYFGKQMGEGSLSQSSSIQRVGDEGEFATFAVNDFRNLVKHQLALTCSQKPSFDPRAKNTDLKSLQQARLASNIIDSYVTEKRLGRYLKSAAERALALTKGYVQLRWDPASGRAAGVEPVVGEDGQQSVDEKTGEPHEKVVYEGDVECEAFSPWDVMYDIHLTDWSKRDWDIVRLKRNKFTLAAKYPKAKEELVRATGHDDMNEYGSWKTIDDDETSSDLIPVYEFYHKRTDALPNGRYTVFLNKDVCLYDGPIQYKKLNVFRITPGEVFDTAEGYSESADILVLQQALNVLYSTAFTNNQAFGVQAIWMPEGCDLNASELGKGLAVLKGGPPGTKPEALQLTSTPPELYKLAEMIEQKMETVMGINSVVRGDPEHNLKSGAALGRMQAMAVQFASNFQESWAELQEDAATFLLDLLKDFGKTERMVALAGKHNRGAMRSFTGEDLDGIDRVVIDLGNPMSRTVAGRLDMADMLIGKGLIKTPQEYIGLIATGQLEPLTEGPQAELDLIRKENEDLMDGKPANAIAGDPHLLHIQEHRSILADSALRAAANMNDPMAGQVVQQTLQHIMQHKQIYQTQDPMWSMVSGEPPPPPPPPMSGGPMPPPGPGGPPPPGPHGPPPHGGPPGHKPALMQPPPGPQGDHAGPPPMPPVPKPPGPPMAG
jgi:hypothetical protein